MKNEKFNKVITSKMMQIRKENNLTQSDLGQMLGITRTALINIEKGRQNLDLIKVYTLCCLFEIEPNQFFPEIKKIEVLSKKVKKIIPKKVKYELVYKKVEAFK